MNRRSNADTLIRISFDRQVALFACLVVAWILSGCGTSYPTVSTDCYDLAKSLTTVCNLRKSDQLPRLRQLTADRQLAGKISVQERKILETIVQEAEGGDWERAEDQARQLLAAQQNDPKTP